MFKRVLDPAFDIEALILKDESVRDYQHYPYVATTPNQRRRIELRVQDTSRYFVLAEALLEVTGELVTYVVANSAYRANVRVGLVNNGIMALFLSASYNTDGRVIEIIQDNVDVATTLIGLGRYSDDYTSPAGPTMMFAKDNADLADHHCPNVARRPQNNARTSNADVKDLPFSNPEYILGFTARTLMLSGDRRRFSCAIPLSHVFGFCRGVQKVIFGASHTVVLHRKGDDNDDIWREDGVAGGKVILSKLALWMPVMSPSIADRGYCLLLTHVVNH